MNRPRARPRLLKETIRNFLPWATVSMILTTLPPVRAQEATVQITESPSLHQATSAPVRATRHQGLAEVLDLQVAPGWVELTLSAPVDFHHAALRGDARRSDRYYIDVSPVSLNRQLGAKRDIPTGPIRRVRISQFHASLVRVVLDLREARRFQVTALTEPYRLVIAVDEAEGAASWRQPNAQATTAVQTQQRKTRNPDVFPSVAWRTATQSWTLMSHATPAQTTSPPPPANDKSPPRPLHIHADTSPLVDQSISGARVSSPDFTPFLTQLSLSDRRHDSLAPFSSANVATAREADHVSQKSTQDAIRTEGSVMREVWMVVMVIGVLLSFLAGVGVMVLWNTRKQEGQPAEKSDGWEARMAYLGEAVNRAGMLNQSFFHSLEISQKRLETLLTQADVTEQNLRRLLHQAACVGEQPPGRGADVFATAALLLAEGEEAPHVARTLKLPLAQVRLLQELRQHAQKEKSAESEKSAAVRRGPVPVAVGENEATRLNGAARNGTHLAQSEQRL